MLTANTEFLIDNLDEIKTLLGAHYDELSVHKKHGYKLDPNYPLYIDHENKGQLLFITLRKEGKMVGYFIGFITKCLHYQVLTLSMDILFIHPNERGHRGGVLLMRQVLKEFQRRNIRLCKLGTKIYYEELTGHQLTRLLRLFKFEPFETTYSLWAG